MAAHPVAVRPLALALSAALVTASLHAAPLQFEVLESTASRTVLRIDVPAPDFREVDTPEGRFLRFAPVGGKFPLALDQSRTGAPELPVAGFNLALPVDGDGKPVVRVKPGGTERSLALRAPLYPVQPPEHALSTDRSFPKFAFDPKIYLADKRGAGDQTDQFQLFSGDANVQGLQFSPYGYDPERGTLHWFDSIIVTVDHPGSCYFTDHLLARNPTTGGAPAGYDAIDVRLEKLPLPAVQLAANRDLIGQFRCVPTLSPSLVGARFLIVTHRNFETAADTLAAHKIARGLSTRVVTTHEIAAELGILGAASKTQIRNWIADYYNDHAIRPKWVMLLGDAEFLPTHYDANKNSGDEARNAGDMWYGQFLPGATATTIPPFGLGRLPVDTLAQANTIVNKVIAFETLPPVDPLFGSDFYNRLTFASFFESQSANITLDTRWFVEVTEQIRDHSVGLGYSPLRLYNAPAGHDPRTYRSLAPVPADLRKPGFGWDATSGDLIDAINAGTTLLYHRDHGSVNGFGDPDFSIANLGSVAVTNNRFPTVFSINCSSGLFDNETVNAPANVVGGGLNVSTSSTYWAEAFVRKADGALAVIGDTRSSSTVDNGHLAIGLFDAIFPTLAPDFGSTVPIQRLGDILNHGKAFLAAVAAGTAANRHPDFSNGAPPGISDLRQELNIYNLLGDPTVKLMVRPALQISIGNLVLEASHVRFKIAIDDTCLRCPPSFEAPFVVVVAIDPKTRAVLGRTLVEASGDGSIDLGDFKGQNVILRATSPDGESSQIAVIETDSDGDGVPDSHDNCLAAKNPKQTDGDTDGYGNACDGDFNNDGVANAADFAALRANFGKRDGADEFDLNEDGAVNAGDLARMRQLFLKLVGPAALRD